MNTTTTKLASFYDVFYYMRPANSFLPSAEHFPKSNVKSIPVIFILQQN